MLAALAIVLLVLCLAVFLVVDGRDVAQALGPLIGYTTPTVTLLFAYAGLSAKLDEVHKQVNGNFHNLTEENTSLTNRLANIAETGQVPNTENGGKHSAD